MEKKLLVFDLDGTLIDTLKDLNIAVNYSLNKHGFELRSLEHTRKSIGDGVAMLVKRSLPETVTEIEYADVLENFEEYYKLHSNDNTSPYPGMKETLIKLKEKGYLLAVSTNKIEDVAISLIDDFYPNIFDTVCGDNKVRQRKPSPDSINEICRRLSFNDKNNITYIGDTEVDFMTANNSKVGFILVSYGYRTEEEQIAKKLTVLGIKKPENLLKIL